MITRNIGGDRLGSGGKMNVNLRTFDRSTHNLSKVWRNTQAPGTLVPFMKLVALPGDTFDIDLYAQVMTNPTVGPLFGTFKLQLDVFKVPIRLYQAQLHNNSLGIGLNMKDVYLPQISLFANGDNITPDWLIEDNTNLAINNINPSSLLSYLGIKGIGVNETDEQTAFRRNFNAIPYIAYWDIYKNYYANKQEEYGKYILPRIQEINRLEIKNFKLSNLDDMREIILQHPKGTPFVS